MVVGNVFAPLLIPVDSWNANAIWIHAVLIVWIGWLIWSGKSIPINPSFPVACWALWTGIQFLWNWTRVMIEQNVYALTSLMPFANAVAILLAYLLLGTLTQEQRKGLYLWVARLSVSLALYGLYQRLFGDPFVGTHRVIGLFGNVNAMGAWLAITLPFCLLRTGKRWIVGAILVAAAIILTGSRGAVLSCLPASALYLWNKDKRISISLVGLTILVALLIPMELSTRFVAWNEILSMTKHHWIGDGLGAIRNIWSNTDLGLLSTWNQMHNEYLAVMVEQGIIGLISTLVVFLSSLFSFIRRNQFMCVSALLAFMLNALVNFPGHLWSIGIIVMFVLSHKQEDVS